ncbi:MAG: hypothetical protein R3345_05100 [Fulvivirga sp.]|nr:hypothetical protein [Fulvivirga sp.]
MKLFFKIFLSLYCLAPITVLAQDDWDTDGEIEDVEVEIVKDRDIKLPNASRNFDKIPSLDTSDKEQDLTYFYNTLPVNLPKLDLRIRPLRIKDQPLQKLYGNYVKAGYGNYNTPYFEGYVNNKRNKTYSYGAHINYLNSQRGPVDDENSGSGSLDVETFGKAFGKKATLSGDLGYHRNNYHFYGYDEGIEVDADSIKQVFNRFNSSVALENTRTDDAIQYKMGLNYNYLSDDYSDRESEFGASFLASYAFSDETSFNLSGDLALISREAESFDRNRTFFRFRPVVKFTAYDFIVEAGFNAVYENDTLRDGEELHFYPLIQAKYKLTDYFEVYAGISGDVEKQTLNSLTRENPFLQQNQAIFHTNKTFDFYGGINGRLSSKIGFKAGISIANYQNLHYFINDSTDQSRFLAVFDDENTAVVNLFGALSWSTGGFSTSVRGDYWGYDASDAIGGEAWHRPNYKLSVLSGYNFNDKILLNADLYSVGGIKALDTESGEEVSLDALIDLNLKVDYLVSDQVSAFVQLRNIFGQEYELLYRYPSRQFQFMAGITYSF